MATAKKYVVSYASQRNQIPETTHLETDLRRALKWAREAVEEGYCDQAKASVYSAGVLVARYVNDKGKAIGLVI
jgi:hypothetical protein